MVKVEKLSNGNIKVYGKIMKFDEYKENVRKGDFHPILKGFKELGADNGGYFGSRKKPGTDE